MNAVEEAPSLTPPVGQIVFLSHRESIGVPGAPQSQLYVVGSDGSGERQLTDKPFTDMVTDYSVSADGRTVAFERWTTTEGGALTENLALATLDGTLSAVTHNTGTHGGADWLTDPQWDPDGQSLVVTQHWGIRRISRDGSVREAIRAESTYDWKPRVSPDGSRIAFWSGEQPREWQLHVMRADGSEVRDLCPDLQCGEGAWTPDGSSVVFSTSLQDPSITNGIWIRRADGTGLRRLVESAAGQYSPIFPVVSPDGTQVAFVATGFKGDLDILVVDIDGREVRTVVSESGDDREPSFSPDGSWIAYSSHRDGKDNIFVRGLDSGLEFQLTSSDGNRSPTWVGM
jgi:Tol biopolymer transport system component